MVGGPPRPVSPQDELLRRPAHTAGRCDGGAGPRGGGGAEKAAGGRAGGDSAGQRVDGDPGEDGEERGGVHWPCWFIFYITSIKKVGTQL